MFQVEIVNLPPLFQDRIDCKIEVYEVSNLLLLLRARI